MLQKFRNLARSLANLFCGRWCRRLFWICATPSPSSSPGSIVSTTFVENGTPYVDMSGHLQLLEADKLEDAPRVTFYNRTENGEKRGHYSYGFHEKNNGLTLREFDGNGKFRFDCNGTYTRKNPM